LGAVVAFCSLSSVDLVDGWPVFCVPAQLRRGFDSTVLLVSWRLWKERNSRTFDNSASTVQQVAKLVLELTDEWIAAGFVAIAEFLVVSSVV